MLETMPTSSLQSLLKSTTYQRVELMRDEENPFEDSWCSLNYDDDDSCYEYSKEDQKMFTEEEEEELMEELFNDRDTDFERNVYRTAAWRKRVQASGDEIWTDVLDEYSFPVKSVRNQWVQQTMIWLRYEIRKGVQELALEKDFQQRKCQDQLASNSILQTRRREDVAAAIKKYGTLTEEEVLESLEAISQHREGASLVYHMVRYRVRDTLFSNR